MKRISCWSAAFAALALAAGCAGRGGGSPGSGGNGSGNGGSGRAGGTPGAGGNNPGAGGSVVAQQATAGLGVFSAACSDGKASVGSTPVRRISRVEYNNMVRDLGLDPNNTQPGNQFVSEQKIDTGKAGNFNTNTYATVSGTLMNQQYLEAAEGLASAVAANNNNQLTNLRRLQHPERRLRAAVHHELRRQGVPRAAGRDGDDEPQQPVHERQRKVRLCDRHPGRHRGRADVAAIPVRPRVRSAERDRGRRAADAAGARDAAGPVLVAFAAGPDADRRRQQRPPGDARPTWRRRPRGCWPTRRPRRPWPTSPTSGWTSRT